MAARKSRLFLVPFSWAGLAFLAICAYSVFAFLFIYRKFIFCCYGISVVVDVGSYDLLATLQYALPFFLLVFAGVAFRSMRSEKWFTLRRTIWLSVLIAVVSFILFGYGHPLFTKKLTSTLYDVRMQTPEQNFGGYEALCYGPGFLTFSELDHFKYDQIELAMQTHADLISDLQQNLSERQLDTLLKDPAAQRLNLEASDFSLSFPNGESSLSYAAQVLKIQTASRTIGGIMQQVYLARYEQGKMWMYPGIVLLLFFIGCVGGKLMRKLHFSIFIVIGFVVGFPLYSFSTQLGDSLVRTNKIPMWIGVCLNATILSLVLIVLIWLIRRRKKTYMLDVAFVEEHRHELHRFEELREEDEY